MNLQEIQALIDDHAQESPTLEIKAGAALGKSNAQRAELIKDISALANAGGGRAIYGVAQADLHGIMGAGALDPVADPAMTGDWITQVVRDGTMPPLSCFKCEEIAAPKGRVIVVSVEQSSTAHQSLQDYRYWMRVGATSTRMLDFQIRDVMSRRTAPVIDVELRRFVRAEAAERHEYGIEPILRNVGHLSLDRWQFELDIPWIATSAELWREQVWAHVHRQDMDLATGRIWRFQYTSSVVRNAMASVELHPGQELVLGNSGGLPHVRLEATARAWPELERHRPPLRWRLYMADAKPLEGELAFRGWCAY